MKTNLNDKLFSLSTVPNSFSADLKNNIFNANLIKKPICFNKQDADLVLKIKDQKDEAKTKSEKSKFTKEKINAKIQELKNKCELYDDVCEIPNYQFVTEEFEKLDVHKKIVENNLADDAKKETIEDLKVTLS